MLIPLSIELPEDMFFLKVLRRQKKNINAAHIITNPTLPITIPMIGPVLRPEPLEAAALSVVLAALDVDAAGLTWECGYAVADVVEAVVGADVEEEDVEVAVGSGPNKVTAPLATSLSLRYILNLLDLDSGMSKRIRESKVGSRNSCRDKQ